MNDLLDSVIPEWTEEEFTLLQLITRDLSEADGSFTKGEVRTLSDLTDNYAVFEVWSNLANRDNDYSHRVAVEKKGSCTYSIRVNAGVELDVQDFKELIERARDNLWPAI